MRGLVWNHEKEEGEGGPVLYESLNAMQGLACVWMDFWNIYTINFVKYLKKNGEGQVFFY